MQYTITINQRAAIESGLPLHKDHLPIIECLAHKIGTDRLEVVIEDGREYTWVNHQMIIDDLPLWKFEKRTVQRRIAELEEMGIVIRAKGQFAKGRTYYRKGYNWELLFNSTPDTKAAAPDNPDTGTPDNPDTAPCQNWHGTITTNSSTNSTKENTRFEKFWKDYKKKVDRAKCEKKFFRLSIKEQDACLASVPLYLAYLEKTGGLGQYQKNPLTYLNGKCWETDWQDMANNAGAPKRPKKQIHQRARLDASNSAWAHLE